LPALKIKILTLISGGDVGGAKTHVLSLLQAINQSIEANMICFTEGGFVDDARKMGIPTRVIDSGNIFRDIAKLKAIIAAEHYDIIHAHGSRGNFMATLVKKWAGLPIVSTVHSDYRLDYLGRPLANLGYGSINKIALRRIDYLIGVSGAMTDLLVERGFPADSIFTIYNGIDMSREVTAVPRSEFLKSFNLHYPDDSILVGIGARLNPVKDIATLIRSFAGAAAINPRLRLLIAGDGPEASNLRSLAAELGMSDKIAFLGWVQNMDSFYACLDINTLTSLTETFSYVLTEGARFSLATISSRVGGVTYLIDNGVSGLLFEPGDVDALTEHLTVLAEDEELRGRLGRKLYEKTKRVYSLEATCRTQLDIYQSVLRRHSHRVDKRYGLAICGAYGVGNVGDESILEAILAEIREIDPEIPVYVLSKNPKDTRRKNKVRSVHTFSILSFFRITHKISLYINGGGNLIQDDTSRRSLWFYLYTIMAAKKRGAKVIMYGCGIGPINYAFDMRLSSKIINKYVDVITLREDGSVAELEKMGVTRPEIFLAADPALSLNAAGPDIVDSILFSEGLRTDGNYICFMVRKWPGFEEKIDAFAKAADYVSKRYRITPVFLPIDHQKDVEPSQQISARMETPHHIIKGEYSAGAVTGILSRMWAVVSMRLHGLVFASGHGVPLVGVVYEPKVSAYLRYIGQDNFMELAEVTSSKLISSIDEALKRGRSEDQAKAVARLWEIEKVNRTALEKLMKQKPRE
jgi:polysaccharide pyruvyl transferase CsaB